MPADPTPPRAGDLAESWTRYARELAKAHGVWDEAVTEGRTAAAADLELIRDLADPDPCWFDHHGYCQAHGWTATNPRCPHARAAARIAEGTETDATA
jgi:hypothetical protein